MEDVPEKMYSVTRVDREAAAGYADKDGEYFYQEADRKAYIETVLAGELDGDLLVQAFARARQRAEALLVKSWERARNRTAPDLTKEEEEQLEMLLFRANCDYPFGPEDAKELKSLLSKKRATKEVTEFEERS